MLRLVAEGIWGGGGSGGKQGELVSDEITDETDGVADDQVSDQSAVKKNVAADEFVSTADNQISSPGNQVSSADIGEMMARVMMIPGTNFSEITKNSQFQKVLKKTIEEATEMMTGASRIIQDLPEGGLTVGSGLATIAELMQKNSTRSSSHDFTDYIIHTDKNMAMDIMTKMYDSKSGVKVVWLTLFFIEKGLLTEPSPNAIIDTFNVKKFTKQLYSSHKGLSIPPADYKAFSACFDNLVASYK